MMKLEISPSILAADKSKMQAELDLAQSNGAKFIHVDVMDGKFVPATTLSLEFVRQWSKSHGMINDVHIMVEEPWVWGPLYAEAGADILTFHYEACPNDEIRFKTIDLVRSKGCKVGMSIKPATDAKELFRFIDKLDLVLVMSVEPGKGGQSFMPEALDKIKALSLYIKEHDLDCIVEVDGGINQVTGKQCVDAGANLLVAGSYLFGHDDFAERAKGLLSL